MSEMVKGAIQKTQYELPNLAEASAPEILVITTQHLPVDLTCNMSGSVATDEICSSIVEMHKQWNAVSMPNLSVYWHDNGLEDIYDEDVGQCLGEIEVARMVSMEIFLDGDPARPLSKARVLVQASSSQRRGDRIYLGHPVLHFEDRPTDEMGIAEAFVVNTDIWDPDGKHPDVESLIQVKVRFEDGFETLMNFDHLVRPRI